MKKFYITTAIDYPSGNPHMGHCYEKICSDVIARWKRLELGQSNVFFQTGMDEHGLKIQRIAKSKDLDPKDYVNQMSKIFKKFNDTFNISYDYFIRTTDKEHIKFCQDILQKVYDNGDIYKDTYKGLYCVDCETYFRESDLKEKHCPYHNKICEYIEEESYFFKLSKYKDKIIKYVQKNKYILPEDKREYILGRLKNEEVKDLCISRSNFVWGVQIPFDKKHYTYVWFDALLNYASGLNTNKKSDEFWPASLHIIGYDILWHHSVIWLSMLLSAGLELPKNVFAHGFVNAADGSKMSKSVGNVIDPIDISKKYPIDSIRYYLVRDAPFGSDLNFSEESLVSRHNNELVNDLGNLLNRTVVMINKYFNNVIPKKAKDELSSNLKLKKICKHMDNYELSYAIAEIWKFINCCNKYINDNKPWELAKTDKKRLAEVIYNLADSLRMIALLIKPFMPTSSEKIVKALGIKDFEKQMLSDVKFGKIKSNKITKSKHLFEKIEIKEVQEMKQKPVDTNPVYKTFDEWKGFDLRVGEIIKVQPHPKADKLYVMVLDMGDCEPDRQVVAGIKEHYPMEKLIGKKVVVLVNLKPAVIRGVESNGMILAADDGKNVKLICPENNVKNGSKVY